MSLHYLPTLIVVLAMVVPMASCTGQEKSQLPEAVTHPDGNAVTLQDVEGYDMIEIPFPVAAVVQTREEWERVNMTFVNHFHDDGTDEVKRVALPEINFAEMTVVVVSLGEVPCMLTEPVKLIDRAVISSDTLHVGIGTRDRPVNNDSADDICLTAIDYLVHAVWLPKHNGPIHFYGRTGSVPGRRNIFE